MFEFVAQRILRENILKDRFVESGDHGFNIGNVFCCYFIPFLGLLAKHILEYGKIDSSRQL